MMKYIDIKRENVTVHDMIDDEEKDVIFYYHWFDTLYDHKSEDMGRMFGLYVNKNKKKDIKIKYDKEGYQVIIYKDKYRFNGNPSYN